MVMQGSAYYAGINVTLTITSRVRLGNAFVK